MADQLKERLEVLGIRRDPPAKLVPQDSVKLEDVWYDPPVLKAQCVEHAKAHSVKVTSRMSKREIVEALRTAGVGLPPPRLPPIRQVGTPTTHRR